MVMHSTIARALKTFGFSITIGLATVTGLAVLPAHAAVLTPGQTAATDGLATFSGTAIHTETDPFSSGTFVGSLTSTVYQQSNGDLDFVYQFTNNNIPDADPIVAFTVSGYNYLFANADDQTVASDVSPYQVSRNPVDGSGLNDTINFNFPNATPVNPGQTSDLLVIDTTATNWYEGSASLQDSLTANVQAPAPVPEPATAAILTTGILGLLYRPGRKQSAK
jgi:hypothetical protein